MFFGVHLLLYSRDPEADRAFFRDVLGFTAVDAGHGWLIFAMPPAEMAVHPSEAPISVAHAGQDLASGTVYLMCKNLAHTLALLEAKGVPHSEIQEARWGVVTSIPLPGGGNLGLYEPRHPLAIPSPAG
jgi:catechol 2,3-dioxygenase-like lactoylglutathione lyase family enzyme